MTLDEIFEQWSNDARIDRLELGSAALDIPKLHHKYYRMLSNERLRLKKMEADFAELMQDKKAWCSGELTSEELKSRGWNQQLKKMLKSEVDEFLKADKDVIAFTLKMAMQKEKTEVLDSIIKTITNRSFHINNAISWEKFKAGM
jgi:hypothetical protein